MATHLEDLIALRDKLLADMATAPPGWIASYALDGEHYKANVSELITAVEKLNGMIVLEQQRVPGRTEIRVVNGRGRGLYPWRGV